MVWKDPRWQRWPHPPRGEGVGLHGGRPGGGRGGGRGRAVEVGFLVDEPGAAGPEHEVEEPEDLGGGGGSQGPRDPAPCPASVALRAPDPTQSCLSFPTRLLPPPPSTPTVNTQPHGPQKVPLWFLNPSRPAPASSMSPIPTPEPPQFCLSFPTHLLPPPPSTSTVLVQPQAPPEIPQRPPQALSPTSVSPAPEDPPQRH